MSDRYGMTGGAILDAAFDCARNAGHGEHSKHREGDRAQISGARQLHANVPVTSFVLAS